MKLPVNDIQAPIRVPPSLPLFAWSECPGVNILRGDLLHPIVSGNKLFKVMPLLDFANASGLETVLSVGGRFSNHLHALSWAAGQYGLKSVGLIRGFTEQPLTQTLVDCAKWGMDLHFMGPAHYQKRHAPDFWQPWQDRYPSSLIIHEGGWSKLAIQGSERWWSYIPKDTRRVVCAVGSGCTLAGLLKGAPRGTSVVAVPAYRDPDNHIALIEKLHAAGISTDSLEILEDPMQKRFGRLSEEHRRFKAEFEASSGIMLDPIYTTKVLYAIWQRWQTDADWQLDKTIVLHTGGLQGNRS